MTAEAGECRQAGTLHGPSQGVVCWVCIALESVSAQPGDDGLVATECNDLEGLGSGVPGEVPQQQREQLSVLCGILLRADTLHHDVAKPFELLWGRPGLPEQVHVAALLLKCIHVSLKNIVGRTRVVHKLQVEITSGRPEVVRGINLISQTPLSEARGPSEAVFVSHGVLFLPVIPLVRRWREVGDQVLDARGVPATSCF
mmetsp:Transcript_34445/g.55358  ORF Transcript_34445/g.55358 Transcript_34445/m.55358 type:complete len:200 (-) Transcript_34445:22-621(-)